MTLPTTAYPPPFNITRASHVVLGVRDLEASRTFYADMLGLVVSDQDAAALYLRGLEERSHHSLVLQRRIERTAPSRERQCFQCVGRVHHNPGATFGHRPGYSCASTQSLMKLARPLARKVRRSATSS